MSFFLTLVIVGLVAYVVVNRNKYKAELEFFKKVVSDLNNDLFDNKVEITSLENKVFLKEKEISTYKLKLESMMEINKDLNENKSSAEKSNYKEEKPKSKRPYYRKKKKPTDNA
jgi:hypothetical protein